MKGIDTNVLIRYLVQDDPAQARAATRFIERECSPEEPGYINHIVLCEIVWVLEACYGQGKGDIVRVLEQILKVAPLQVENPQVVWRAIEDYRAGEADLGDHLLARVNQDRGCEGTATFDRRALKAPGFLPLR